jgi:hypothetical protein
LAAAYTSRKAANYSPSELLIRGRRIIGHNNSLWNKRWSRQLTRFQNLLRWRPRCSSQNGWRRRWRGHWGKRSNQKCGYISVQIKASGEPKWYQQQEAKYCEVKSQRDGNIKRTSPPMGRNVVEYRSCENITFL